MAAPDEPTPLVRVLRGNPDPAELAAITAVMALVTRRQPAGTPDDRAAYASWAGTERFPAPRRPSWRTTS
ncbi:acyl-CoA carboxylase subunit epsilon [Streptomyces sp. WELS2]|uniref:acyl-CoA carboxylase subunit epsilon n=1 Tax=Streptomyces sp. WELS2 TaxID=2749435 RepID=UPI0015F06364|nr:acyl-CoA carboxylase subunit epsilon [Streptomyces sp. WELS2]